MPNRLAAETSPYLLQHADNPVDWYPWGPEALEKARREDKPILLSIGYSACHWCHVMAHESFEDPATAEVMNRLYVNIKVDREERPDLDKIYQMAHQILTRRPGGWPLTVILTPDDHVPFFAGTYFPREPAHGMPPFTVVLERVAQFYREHRDEIERQNAEVLGALHAVSLAAPPATAVLGPAPLDQARRRLGADFDREYGGFGGAPKFPHPTSLERLLRHWAATRGGGEDREALDMVRHTLHAMASGGIYDQLGGGFCRYSVDERWEIPHFEKMLYDNGPLLALYAQAHAATGEAVFARVARETAQWAVREMQSPEGGFYSALDADSEGEEGRFYVWTPDEARAVLDEDEYAVAARFFGLDGPPNFEGRWHLVVRRGIADVAEALGLSPEETGRRLTAAREKLLAARAQRVRPGRDEKVLTSWNALMIRGLAVAGRLLAEPAWLDAAARALDFIHRELYRGGRLLATCKDGRARLNAYLDDYAFLLDALLEFLQSRWRDDYARWAQELAAAMLAHFEDGDNGGFFFTADDHERLIQRLKPYSDDATPAGNGIAAFALQRLGHLLGEPRFHEAAERTLRCAWEPLSRFPQAHCALLLALEEHLYPPELVIVRGGDAGRWLEDATTGYLPRRLAFALPADADPPGLLAQRRVEDGATRAWICRGTRCEAPVDSPGALAAALAQAG